MQPRWCKLQVGGRSLSPIETWEELSGFRLLIFLVLVDSDHLLLSYLSSEDPSFSCESSKASLTSFLLTNRTTPSLAVEIPILVQFANLVCPPEALGHSGEQGRSEDVA